MPQWVEISFDCLPLRSVPRLDAPIDASPAYRQLCDRIKHAIEKHGSHNSYYLLNALCTFHLTNDPELGMVQFRFEGTVLTDPNDRQAQHCDLDVLLKQETCDWLTEPIVTWLADTVRHAVSSEFDRYIEAGDLEKTHERIRKVQESSDAAGGFVGMYL